MEIKTKNKWDLIKFTPWTVACQAPLSMGFSRQEYWSELPFPPPGDFPDPRIEPESPALVDEFFTTEPPRTTFWKSNLLFVLYFISAAATAAKSLQSCPTLCDPRDGSPPGFPSLGFSRQEHWSGLPFPSLMHESEKWKWSRLVVSDS